MLTNLVALFAVRLCLLCADSGGQPLTVSGLTLSGNYLVVRLSAFGFSALPIQ